MSGDPVVSAEALEALKGLELRMKRRNQPEMSPSQSERGDGPISHSTASSVSHDDHTSNTLSGSDGSARQADGGLTLEEQQAAEQAEIERLSKLSHKDRQYELWKKKHNIVITPMSPEELAEYQEEQRKKAEKANKGWFGKKKSSKNGDKTVIASNPNPNPNMSQNDYEIAQDRDLGLI